MDLPCWPGSASSGVEGAGPEAKLVPANLRRQGPLRRQSCRLTQPPFSGEFRRCWSSVANIRLSYRLRLCQTSRTQADGHSCPGPRERIDMIKLMCSVRILGNAEVGVTGSSSQWPVPSFSTGGHPSLDTGSSGPGAATPRHIATHPGRGPGFAWAGCSVAGGGGGLVLLPCRPPSALS